ncbi:MAG: molybdopterin-dependent oxidoreductase [Alphaproteobacteria bacterium]|jgi:anaerobic selenocysteine-containing dehydrogenase/Fe-S-cluster-containing dehydrogenase component|nr:molybdopterin-dependent oxidoreductase [Alphaproteobacteria bacterium]
MDRLALMIDLERCIGCKSCEVACKQEHGLGPGEYRNRVLWLGRPDRAALDFLTVACQHCERPACLRACPINPKAITKDPVTGVVEVVEDRCTGCGECVVACPYGAMGYDAIDHHSVKCDLCADRRAEGLTTACVSVCPGYAIDFGKRDELLAQAEGEGREVRDNDPFLMGPATVYLDRLTRNDGEAPDTVAGRTTPALIDDPAARDRLGFDVAQFPYRHERTERVPDRVVPGGCNICFNCCSTKYHFKGDELVKITGNEDDPLLKGRVCPKSQLSLQLYNSDQRLDRPLKRVGKGGENKFEPISWDRALDEIAAKLTGLREAYGPETLAIFSGTRTGLITNKGYIRLFSEMWGTPNVETTEPFCSAGKNLAYALTQGNGMSGNSVTETDIGSAEMYLYVGDNQAETRPVYFGQVNDWRLRNNAKMVVVDPRFTVTASKADRWLAIRPGADMALGLAMARHILANDLHDRAFCEDCVLGWERWRDFLFERDYTPDWAAPITGLAADDIRRLAEEVAAADGCVIFASRGLNQHSNSTQVNRTFMYLAAITGNWGRKGGTYFNMSAAVPIGATAPPDRRAEIERPMVRRSPIAWTAAMNVGKPYPIKALICCNNPLVLWPDLTAAREALEALDLLVHIALFPNETSAYADYVLPAATGIEKGEIGRANDDRRVVWIDRMIDPPGEAKPDGWIWIELGKRLGFDDVLKEDYKDPAVFWDEVLIDNDEMRGCTQRRLHDVPWRWVRFPVASEDAPEVETLFLEGTTATGQPAGKRFATASGKLEFWTEELEDKFQTLGLSALPEFYSEREQLVDLPYVELEGDDTTLDLMSPFTAGPTGARRGRIVQPSENSPGRRLREQGFDTELVTGRPPAPQFHSWTHFAWQAQEMWPDPYVQIHPDKAAALAIEDGERIRVETAHGAIEARAWIYAGIRPSAVFVPIGWGERQPFHPWQPVNYLTDGAQRDPISDQTNLKTLLCRVRPL